MKANEFVKKFGWDAAKAKVAELKLLEDLGDSLGIQDIELKRLVASYEVVESFGGIKSASKAALKENEIGHVINEGLILMHIRIVESCS